MKRLITLILVISLIAVPVKFSALTETDVNDTILTEISQETETNIEEDLTPDTPPSIDNDVVLPDTSVSATQGTIGGYLDGVTTSQIYGWAYNTSMPNDPIDVHVYVSKDGTNYMVNGVSANIYRADLASAGFGNGYHGFACPINWMTYLPGDYNVAAYGINDINNPQLNNSPLTFTVLSARGYIDAVTSSEIRGWVWKPAAPNEPINVAIFFRNQSGTVLATRLVTADLYRAGLVSAGIGNGYHGFSIAVDWSELPQELITVEIHSVDNSGYHPIIYNKIYNNQKKMYLLGARGRIYNDNGVLTGYADFSSWMSNTVVQNVANIDGSQVIKLTDFTPSSTINAIRNSTFLLVNTHGYTNGSGIECENNGIYDSLTISDLQGYSSNYFSGTKCVTLMSCDAGLGGSSNPNNFVNVLQSKGVQTVVGFKDEIWFSYYTDETINDNKSAGLWGKKYVDYLNQGYSVQEAVVKANEDVYKQSGRTNWWGFDSYYIKGNANQILKN